MQTRNVAGALALISISSGAVAGDKVAVHPVRAGLETVRYNQGVATLDQERADGAVQVTPLPMDHGSLSFGIAVYNKGTKPANIGIENFTVRAGPQDLLLLSREELEKKAKNRAMWAQIALAAVGGLGAAAAASQRDHYRSTLITPRGTYRAYYSAPSAVGQVQAVAIAAGAGVGIATVQNRLDETRRALGDNIVQLTTVDPGESYAGQIVIQKIKSRVLPQRLSITVRWNGDDYPFAFEMVKSGTKAPVFEPVPTLAAPVPVGADQMIRTAAPGQASAAEIAPVMEDTAPALRSGTGRTPPRTDATTPITE